MKDNAPNLTYGRDVSPVDYSAQPLPSNQVWPTGGSTGNDTVGAASSIGNFFSFVTWLQFVSLLFN